MLLLLALFDNNNNKGILDNNVKPELVNRLDFAKLGFKQLDFNHMKQTNYAAVSIIFYIHNFLQQKRQTKRN